MCLDVTEIKELEKKSIKARKDVILEKMENYYAYNGIDGGDAILEYLEQNTSFKYGEVLDLNKFKDVYLTSFDRLNKFNDVYLNSGNDVDELLFCGFDDNLVIVQNISFYGVVYEQIMAHEFSNQELNDFEAFVNEKFVSCHY